MQFEATLDQKTMAEAGKMLRRWYAWPLFILRNLYGLLVLGVLVYAGLVNLFGSNTHPEKAAYIGICIAVFGSLGWWLSRRDSLKEKAALDKINPLRFNIETEGFQVTLRNGSSTFSPWSEFKSFREGNGLSTHEMDRLRSYLTVQIVSR